MLRRRFLSLLLTMVMVATTFGALMTVEVSAAADITPTNIDYSALTNDDIAGYTQSGDGSISIDETEDALKIVVPTGKSAKVDIPINAITVDGAKPFSITAVVKMPTDPTNGGTRVYGFPILNGVKADGAATTKDIGFVYSPKNNMFGLKKNGNFDTLKADNGLALTNAQAAIATNAEIDGKYVIYRWEVYPPYNYKLWISLDGGKTYEKVYKDYTFTDFGGAAFTEKGMIAAGTLPATINSLQFSAGTNAADSDTAYYIKSVKVAPIEAITLDAVAEEGFTMDYSTYQTGATLTGYGTNNTNGGTIEIGPSSADTTKNVLKWTPAGESVLTIPFTNAIDTTAVTEFTYEITIKQPSTNAFRHLGSLGSTTSTGLNATNDIIMGVSQRGAAQTPIMTAADRSDGFWGYKTSNNKDITADADTWNSSDKTQDSHNIHLPDGSTHASTGWFINRAEELSSSTVTFTATDYVTYKFKINSTTDTFRFYYDDVNSDGFREPYKNCYMMDGDYSNGTISRLNTAGDFPTKGVPDTIASLKMTNKLGTGTYEISKIKVTTGDPIPALAYTQEPAFTSDGSAIKMSFNRDIIADTASKYITVKNNDTEVEGCTYAVTGGEITITLPAAVERFVEGYTVELNGVETTLGDKLIQTKTVPALEGYDWSFKNADGTFKTSAVTFSKDGTTGAVADGTYNWTAVSGGGTMTVDIDDLTLTTYPVEIAFTAQFPAGGFQLQGFPKLNDGSTDHKFGLDTPTIATLSGTESYKLRQMLALEMGNYNFNKVNAGNTESIDQTYNGNGSAKVSVADVKVGHATDDDITAVGASAAAYDFKFVIDPVSDTYRYYSKAATESEWVEVFEDCAKYPIMLDTVPTSIKSLVFNLNKSDADNVYKFSNITVKELAPYTNFVSNITNRTYTLATDAETSKYIADGAKATIDVTVTNYTGVAQENAQLFLAVYDVNGILVNVVPQTATLAAGKNELSFEDVDASAVAINSGGTAVAQDSYSYKIFVWENTSNIRPLASNVATIFGY